MLLACLLVTGYASYYAKSDVESDAQRQLAYDCDEVQLKIAGRLQAHKQVLLGAAALFDAPFTPEQTAQIKAGRRPEGRL